jgi:DNA invertase Pin-like site-specific DNA recombinase
MEQPKIVIYVRFSTDTDQEEVNRIKDEIGVFVRMIEAKVMKQHWEILSKDTESGILDYVIDECMRHGWSILTYDLKSIHEYISGALSIIEDAAQDQVAIFFVDSDSALKSIRQYERT